MTAELSKPGTTEKPTADDVYHIARANMEVFKDQFEHPFAAIEAGDHNEVIAMDSVKFEQYVLRLVYARKAVIPSKEAISNAIQLLKSEATCESESRNLEVRIATHEGKIYYDLTNKTWDCVEIGSEGWRIIPQPPIFRRFNIQKAQATPDRNPNGDELDRFVEILNVKNEDDKILLKCHIVASFFPEIGKAAATFHGEKGSGKSSAQGYTKHLIDPTATGLLTMPRNIEGLIQVLSHNYATYFDNVSHIAEDVSDTLCKAITGLGYSKRTLYSNDDDFAYNFKRSIGINGINQVITKPDLLDRALLIKLESILDGQRRKDEDVRRDFEALLPKLLGNVFDVMVKVLRVKNEGGIKLTQLPRLADYAETCETIARVLGYPEGAFVEAYNRNIALQNEEAIEQNPIAATIIQFMNGRLSWEGNASDLLRDLNSFAMQNSIDTHNPYWPKAHNQLSRKLNEVRGNLRAKGIDITNPKHRMLRIAWSNADACQDVPSFFDARASAAA